MTELTALSAARLAAMIQSAETTSEEVVRACLDRIAAREPEIGAWAHLDPDQAIAAARAADTVRREGRGVGPLHGVPIGLKDIIDTADMPTENGSAIVKGRQPWKDAACVTALKTAGAVILGKTETTELASLHPARTRNPANPSHTPGGSSAGSAAAVADHMVPAALGTQTAGSVIRPASFCGIVGFKPTVGRIPRRGVTMQSHTLDTVGVLARTVEDAALVADAMLDRDEESAAPIATLGRGGLVAAVRAGAPLPPLLAFVKTPAWTDAAPVMHDGFAELIDELGRLGVGVQELEMPSLADVVRDHWTVMLGENSHHYGPLIVQRREGLSAGLATRLEGARGLSASAYIAALANREPAYARLEDVFSSYTAILTPAAPGPAPEGLGATGSPIFNGLWTYLGVPAVTLPLLEADGLPIGIQLIGARGDDARLLRTARWLEERLA